MTAVNGATTPAASAAKQQQLAQQAMPPQVALASPYDGTTPAIGTPILGTPAVGGSVPQLTGIGGTGQTPQVNATNQTALAPNGDVNQSVTNSNQYSNRFYNIILPTGGMLSPYGGYGMLGTTPGLGSWNTPGNSFIDPQTGVLYVQKEQGFMGWLKSLFRGY